MTKINITIREALSDHDYHRAYPIILQLIPHLDMRTYSDRAFVARATGYRMFIAEDEKGDVIGVIGTIPNHNIHDGFVTYVEHVVVDKKHRGKGYGICLLNFAEERAIEEGCKLIQLDTDENTRAHEFYEKHNYTCTGHYYEKPLDQYSEQS